MMHLLNATVMADSYSSSLVCSSIFLCLVRLPPSLKDLNRGSIDARLAFSMASRSAWSGLRIALVVSNWDLEVFGIGVDLCADESCLAPLCFCLGALPLGLAPSEHSTEGEGEGEGALSGLHGVSGSNPRLCL